MFRAGLPTLAVLLSLASIAAPSAWAENRSAFRAARESVRVEDLGRHVDILADDTFEGRAAGSRGGRAAAVYLTKELARCGLKPAGVGGGWYQPFYGNRRNVLGLIEGSDPHLRHEYILVGAHYDHVGYGTPRNSYGPYGYIHNGADDNASGIAALLEVAEAFSQSGLAPRRSILFAFWDGEEEGLLGSQHWTGAPTVPLGQIRLSLNLDMIGRMRQGQLEIFGTRTAQDLRRLVALASEGSQLQLLFPGKLQRDSDHWSFYERNIPVLMLHTGKHPDYHRPSDDAHKLNREGMQQITRLLLALLVDAANRDSLPGFRNAVRHESPSAALLVEQPAAPLPPRLGVWWDEPQPGQTGLTLTRIVPGSPAAVAGLQVGDRLLKFNGQTLTAGEALREAVFAAEPDVELALLRPGETEPRTLDVTLAGRPSRVGITWQEDAAEPGAAILSRVLLGSPAARAGLRVRDRLYRVGGREFNSREQLLRLFAESEGTTELLIERGGRVQTVELELPPVAPAEPPSP